MDFLSLRDVFHFLFTSFYFDEQTILHVRKTNKFFLKLLNEKETKDKICKNIHLFETPARIIKLLRLEYDLTTCDLNYIHIGMIYVKYREYYGQFKLMFKDGFVVIVIDFVTYNKEKRNYLDLKNDFSVTSVKNKIKSFLEELVTLGFQFSNGIINNGNYTEFDRRKRIYRTEALENINIPYLSVCKGDYIICNNVNLFVNVYQPQWYCKDFFFNLKNKNFN